MDNEYYNGQFTVSYNITVKACNHDMCKRIFNRIKHLVDSLDFGDVIWKDTKSARKGDVLSRGIYIQLKGYAADVLAFRAALDYLIHKAGIYCPSAQIMLLHVETIREDARFDLG